MNSWRLDAIVYGVVLGMLLFNSMAKADGFYIEVGAGAKLAW